MADKMFVAKQMHRFLQIMAQQMELDDSTTMEIADLYEPWEIRHDYKPGKIVKYGVNADNETQLYTVLQEHTSQEDWTPDVAVSLFKKVGFTPSGYPVWTQPLGASDAYMKDDIVSFEGSLWISTIDNNVWQPGVYGWNHYSE